MCTQNALDSIHRYTVYTSDHQMSYNILKNPTNGTPFIHTEEDGITDNLLLVLHTGWPGPSNDYRALLLLVRRENMILFEVRVVNNAHAAERTTTKMNARTSTDIHQSSGDTLFRTRIPAQFIAAIGD